MASIILGNIGSALGGSISGTAIGANIGKLAGSMVGGLLDQRIFGAGNNTVNSSSYRLGNVNIQTSSYGHVIPIIYGLAKVAGNIIWATDIIEHKTTTTHTQGRKWNKVHHHHTNYFYTISLAIAICEGPIANIDRIWADETIVVDNSVSTIRTYLGTEEQMPDPLIENIQGIGNAPAYRGLAYVVFENLNLTSFGNHLPNFSFEIRKSTLDENSVENKISSIVMIPGGGEFVYDTVIQSKANGDSISNDTTNYFLQRGSGEYLNYHNHSLKSNSLLSLDQLKITLPNIKWVAPVVTWFANSLDAGDCVIKPGVEFGGTAHTFPDTWIVNHYTRYSAHKISYNLDRPNYGGSINDQSILRYLEELRKCNYKIMFYPMFFVDLPNKPWRGRITGTPQGIRKFFNCSNGYNNFILHYARLVRDKVDAFVIGSELIGLTSVRDDNDQFPAVIELIKLAKQVKEILGKEVKISYAADWSEYHHTTNGWYNLDPLWSSPDIDFIGIDAYFPLTNWKKQKYNLSKVISGWDSGEGYDFIYTDTERTKKQLLEPKYAWKNLSWWWNNKHIDPNGETTSWIPRSKKIWFTEYGFPSVDLATNQPNIFYDNNSIDSGFPYHSLGEIDIYAQRLGIEATEKRWANSEIVENKFLWTWDARPYPTWPDNNEFWADGNSWITGHWVQGKLGNSTLSALLKDLSVRAGLSEFDIDVTKVNDMVDGLIINQQASIRSIIEKLQQAYFFDVVESDYKVRFISRYSKILKLIDKDDLVPSNDKSDKWCNASNVNDILTIKNLQEADLPSKIDINFINRTNGYKIGNQHARRMQCNSKMSVIISLPLVLDNNVANKIANVLLYNSWIERLQYNFMLSIKYAYLMPTDVIKLSINNHIHQIRITSIELGQNYQLKLSGVAEDISIYKLWNTKNQLNTNIINPQIVNLSIPHSYLSLTNLEVIDIPFIFIEKNLVSESTINKKTTRVLLAACGKSKNWYGCEVFYKLLKGGEKEKDINSKMEFVTVLKQNNTTPIMGAITKSLSLPIGEAAKGYIIDKKNSVIVNLLHGQLYNVTLDELMKGYNLAIIGEELIQFQYARLVNSYQYEISGLLRGLFGSEVKFHQPGERFIVLEENLPSIDIPSAYIDSNIAIKAISLKNTDNSNQEEIKVFKYQGKSAKPLAPTHLKIIMKNNYEELLYWYSLDSDFPGLNKSTDFGIESINEEKVDYGNKLKLTFRIELLSNDQVMKTEHIHDQCYYKLPSRDEIETLNVNYISVSSYNNIAGYGDKAYLKL